MISIEPYAPPAEWFHDWWNPQALLDSVLAHKDAIPGDMPGNLFFNDPALKPLREAYAAAKFARIRDRVRPCEVRLINPASEFPDFEIRFDDAAHQFELTEADRKPRLRGKEYREADRRAVSGASAKLTHYDPDEEMAAAIPAISAALNRKAKKHYQPPPHLLVYINFPTDNGRPPLTDLEAVQLAEPYRTSFASIWLLWGDNAVRCWPNPANIPLRKTTAG
jgi:hypothetical protein